MSQLSFMGDESRMLSVTQLTDYLRDLIETDYRTQDLWVEGEISNLSTPSSGHMYFTLKDQEATLRCVMWRSQVARQRQLPVDGDQVEVHGRIGIYEAGGLYQLYADSVRKAGQGELYRAFLELKDQLESEGLFEAARKRPLPDYPRRIGVITSPTGAALQDALDVLERRFPMAEVVLAETQVQGKQAADGIIKALANLQAETTVDVILLIRGGGSLEDLAAFNDEGVARAIASASIPIVSGVGHETDFTIADFVADVRAPTPSAAAEIVSPDRAELNAGLSELRSRLVGVFQLRLETEAGLLGQWRTRLGRASPRSQLENARQRVDDLLDRLTSLLRQDIRYRQSQLDGRRATLTAVGPPSVLARGYAVVQDDRGNLLRTTEELAVDDRVSIKLERGQFGARVEEIDDEEEQE